jgi:predicted nucleotidyltransferase
MINKNMIIAKLNDALKPLPYIYAFWLEGADANGLADEYSDIDIWVDFEDEYEEQAYEVVEIALTGLAEIDYKYVKGHGSKISSRCYHLAGTSEYLMLDFNWQFHSRPKDEYVFFEDNKIEGYIYFDDGIVTLRTRYAVALKTGCHFIEALPSQIQFHIVSDSKGHIGVLDLFGDSLVVFLAGRNHQASHGQDEPGERRHDPQAAPGLRTQPAAAQPHGAHPDHQEKQPQKQGIIARMEDCRGEGAQEAFSGAEQGRTVEQPPGVARVNQQ